MKPSVKPSADTSMTPDMIRIDRNILQYGVQFKKQFGEVDGQLIYDVLFYASHKYQHKDLFGHGEFYPKDFCSVMKYSPESKSNLNRKVKDTNKIAQFRDLKEGEKLVFDSVVGNALYRALTQSLRFNFSVIDYTKKEKREGVKTYQLLTYLEKRTSLQNKNEVYYVYDLGDTIKLHMAKFFAQIDLDQYSALRQYNCVFLYNYLINTKETLKSDPMNCIKTAAIQMVELFDIAGINIDIKSVKTKIVDGVVKENGTMFPQAKRKLISKLDLILKVTKLDFKYHLCHFSPQANYDNAVIFEFPENEVYSKAQTNPELKNKLTAMNSHTVAIARDNHIKQELIKLFKRLYPARPVKLVFEEWLKNPDKDLSEVITLIIIEYSRLESGEPYVFIKKPYFYMTIKAYVDITRADLDAVVGKLKF